MKTVAVQNIKQKTGQKWLIVITLALFVIFLRLPSLEQPIDNNIGARAYHAQLILAGEPLYGAHHPGHHLPGIYYTYALALWLFGNSSWSIKLLVLPFTIVAVWLMYALGALLFGRSVALLAALFYALLSSHIWLFGATATTELFANTPRIAAFLLALYLIHKRKPPWSFVFVGLLSAAAFLYKAIYLSPLALTAFIVLREAWLRRHEPAIGRATIQRALATAAGFLLLLAPVALYFAALGLLPRLFLVFTLGQSYVNNPEIGFTAAAFYWPIFPLFGLAMNNVVLFMLAAVAIGKLIIFTWRRALRDEQQPPHLTSDGLRENPAIYVGVWFLLSFIEAGINRSFFLHYYLLMAPPLVLLAAWYLVCLREGLLDPIRQMATERRAAITLLLIIMALIPFAAIWPNYLFLLPVLALPATWIVLKLWRRERPSFNGGQSWLILLIGLSLLLTVEQNGNYHYQYARYKAGFQTFDDFLQRGWPEAEAIFTLRQIVAYVDERAGPDDYVFYWSEKAHFYYLSGRRSPIDVIWPIYVGLTGPVAPIFSPQTRYILVDSKREPSPPAWLYAALAQDYELETVIEGQEIYVRVQPPD
jgi:4-amino-4-deoxy-L-arabinose transferase-like glycosyltransferase